MAENRTPEQIKARAIAAMGASLGQLHYELSNEVSWLHVKWMQYRELFDHSPERIDVLNRTAPSFFGYLQITLLEDVLLHVSRLYDPPESFNKANLTLRAIPQHVADDELQTSLTGALTQLEQAVAFARDWRNRRLAHRDLQTYRNEHAQPLAPASRERVERALAAIRRVLNLVEERFLNGHVAYEFIVEPAGDAKALVRHLQRSLKGGE